MTIQVPARWLDALHVAAGRPRFLAAIERNPKQAAFVHDPADRKTALCGRRGGKTTGIAGWLYAGMVEQPGTRQVYIGLTRGTARQILWDNVLQRMAKEYGLPLRETTKDGQLLIQHANGSSIWIAGCDDKREISKFRGQPFYRVNIDEAQGLPEDVLKELIEDALEPALADYGGQIALTGTPGPVDVGYFYEATTGAVPGWSHGHHWDVMDNPWFLDQPAKDSERYANRALEFLGKGLELYGSEEHPTFKREYRGKWVHDPGALVYPFNPDRNGWAAESDHFYGLNPEAEWVFGLGVDLGYSEGAKTLAFTLAASQRGTGNGYILRSYLHDRLYPTRLATYCQGIREEVMRKTGCGLRIVVDDGGLGGGWIEQMQSLGVGCEAAEKKDKRAYQEFVGGLIAAGQLKANTLECRDLLAEARKLPFDPETGKENERFRRHCCDSMLYIVRALFPRYSPTMHGPIAEIGTPGWHNEQAKRDRANAIAEQAKKRRRA